MIAELLRPWALLALPLPVFFWFWYSSRSAGIGLRAPQRLVTLTRTLDSRHGRRLLLRPLRILLAALGWVALVLALSGPQGPKVPLQEASGRDLIIALDLSVSMLQKDVTLNGRLVTRAEAVKSLAGAFIRDRHGDRVGLVAFADRPFLIAPLTFDVAAIDAFLDEVNVGLPGRKTAIGDAIGLSVEQLSRQPQQSRVLVLLTDGDGNAGALSPVEAVRLAVQHDVRIHTIGFSPANTGAKSVQLSEVAQASGGQYFEASNTAALQRVYGALDELEPTISAKHPRHIAQDLSGRFILLALGCAGALAFLRSDFRLPTFTRRNSRRGPLHGSPP